MTKFRINNIYENEGMTLEELISKFILSFLENDFDFNSFNATMSSDTVLNN